jgi:beta-lactamase regulating signal transducer with metallopeptidase domain
MNTLTQIFDWLLAASLRASLLTLATLLIQAAFHRHLTARMHYALWLPVLVVLLMPVLPQSRWSIEHVFQAPPRPVPPTLSSVSPLMEEPAPVVFESVSPMPEPINWQQVFLLGWLSISAGMLVFGSVSFMLTLRRFKQARHPASDELLATLAQIASEMHLRYVPRVLIASSVSSPAVTCLLRPTLLLPAEFDREFTPAEARLVLKHELMHLKRGDLPLNALMCVLMALHWFNPLLWIAFFKIRADREAACDAQVLQDATPDHRIAYGHALLKVETAFSPRGFSLGFVGIFQRGAALRSRIQSIAKHRKPHPSMKAIITLCIALMTFLGITRAQRPEPVRNFTLGQSSFRSGDFIRINSVQTTAETISVAVDYELASEEEASISLFITTKDSGPKPVDPRQRALIKKGKGSVVLVHPNPQAGLPHVTFYSKAGKSFGGIYFGTKAEAAESKKLNLNYLTTSAETKTAPTTDFIKTKLNEIIIPSVKFQGASVEEAIEYLRIKTRELSPGPTAPGVSIIYRQSNPPSKAAISMDLKDVPLGEALRYVVELASLKMIIQPYAVLIGPVDDPVFAKSATAPVVPDPSGKLGEIVITAQETSTDPATEIQTAKGDARCQVGDTSIQAAELVFDRKTHRLKIHGPFTIISGGNQKHSSTSSESSAVLDLTSGKLTTSGPHETKILTPPASKIIIPSIEFRDATLTECIDFILIKSRDLDPDKKGVNIIVKPGGDTSARITLSLKDVPLSEALRYCAELANHKLTTDGQSFILTPSTNNQ